MNNATIINSVAKIMKTPHDDSEMVDDIFYGNTVEVLENIKDTWFKIKTDYNYTGYVNKMNLTMDKKLLDKWSSLDKLLINHSDVDVLFIPKIQAFCVITLTMGALVSPTHKNIKDFTEVILPDNTIGYIKNKFLSERPIKYDYSDEETFRDKVVATAKKYIGTQYRWGGKTRNGIDCSGLTFMSYYLNGVSIYRDAIIKEGFAVRRIKKENIKKGDLLYFPGHIGMYIGQNKFIHSSFDNDGVSINSLEINDKKLYKKKWAENILAVGSIFK